MDRSGWNPAQNRKHQENIAIKTEGVEAVIRMVSVNGIFSDEQHHRKGRGRGKAEAQPVDHEAGRGWLQSPQEEVSGQPPDTHCTHT